MTTWRPSAVVAGQPPASVDELPTDAPVLAERPPAAGAVPAARQRMSSSTMIGLGVDGQLPPTPGPVVEAAPKVLAPSEEPIAPVEPAAAPPADPRPPLATSAGLGPWQTGPAAAPEPPAARAALGSITQIDLVPSGSVREQAIVAPDVVVPPPADSRPELATIVDEGPWPAALDVDLERLTPWPGRAAAGETRREGSSPAIAEAEVAPSHGGASADVAAPGPVHAPADAAASHVAAPSHDSASADVAAFWPVTAAPVSHPAPEPSSPDGTDLLPPVWEESLEEPPRTDCRAEQEPPRASSPNETLRMDPLDEGPPPGEMGEVPQDSPSHSRSIAPLTLSEPFELEPPPRRARSLAAAAFAALVTAAAFLVLGAPASLVRAESGMRAPAALVVLCPHGDVAAAAKSSVAAPTDVEPSDQPAATEKAEPDPPAPLPTKPAPARARRAAPKAGSQWLSQVDSKPGKNKKKSDKKKRPAKRKSRRAKR